MHVRLRLALPSEVRSVPLARKVLSNALSVLDVSRECIDDISVALSEACTNVLLHAGEHHEYDVSVGVDDDCCVIDVRDAGNNAASPVSVDPVPDADADAEHGRGIQLMGVLVDKLDFTICADHGTVVRLQKTLVYG
jgi:serine/threonine-protein kinase RsbW